MLRRIRDWFRWRKLVGKRSTHSADLAKQGEYYMRAINEYKRRGGKGYYT